ncbi:unnamed protein product [Phytomonas sp. Hart1]|nr:unnamed protein product [Phytomonas sp. Hart1]|eukprot:CCW66184.1 unnamed protein product [Phytomonas sp. isolate Hart1]
MEDLIRKKIQDRFNPKELEVIVISAEEAKYSVHIVSDAFQNLKVFERHRMVNDLFEPELSSEAIHSLSINAKPPPAAASNPS